MTRCSFRAGVIVSHRVIVITRPKGLIGSLLVISGVIRGGRSLTDISSCRAASAHTTPPPPALLPNSRIGSRGRRRRGLRSSWHSQRYRAPHQCWLGHGCHHNPSVLHRSKYLLWRLKLRTVPMMHMEPLIIMSKSKACTNIKKLGCYIHVHIYLFVAAFH